MTADMTLMQRLAALLKLPPETDANTILAALEKVLAQPATPDPKDYVPATAMAELLRDRNAHIAMQAEATANTRVTDAIRTGHIIPAMREWATALCTQDPDSFETFIRQSAPAYAHLTRPLNFGKAPPPYAKTHDSDVAAAICTQLGLPPGSLNT